MVLIATAENIVDLSQQTRSSFSIACLTEGHHLCSSCTSQRLNINPGTPFPQPTGSLKCACAHVHTSRSQRLLYLVFQRALGPSAALPSPLSELLASALVPQSLYTLAARVFFCLFNFISSSIIIVITSIIYHDYYNTPVVT